MFDGIFLKFVQSLLAEKPDKRIVSFSFKNKTYFVKRRMSNGRNTFAKKDPSTAFWCEAYKIMTVNARLPLAPKIVLLDEDFFVMEGAGKTLQGVAKEAEYADVRRDAFEKAGQGLAQLHAAGLHSCFREEWPDNDLIDAAVAGYYSVEGSKQTLTALKEFIADHHALFACCHALVPFGWIDIVSVDKAKTYVIGL